ncbi:MAG TPA: hypothetical protein VF017_20660 [Thermoanaerobaculia bacterium]|nr:hypothetical protein [Thermoanaerobaculia bacterium]
MDERPFLSIGLDFRTGEYLCPPLSAEQVRSALGAHLKPRPSKPHGVDLNNLATCGWGVVFAEDDPSAAAAREALAPLLALRRQQAEAGGRSFYRELAGDQGVRAGDSGSSWLARHGAMPGILRPADVPAYLLLVGSPEHIPLDFQSELSGERSVGRVWLDDLDELAAWAAAVAAAEEEAAGPGEGRRPAWVFAPRNAGDRATELTSELLVPAVRKALTARGQGREVHVLLGPEATRERLVRLLQASPALLFAACHGCGPDPFEPDLLGALIGQDWPGPGIGGLRRSHVLAGPDVPPEADLSGLISVLFSCYGAGLPAVDPFRPGAPLHPTGPRLSPLAQGLLARGTQAVVAHLDRAFLVSFFTPGGQPQPALLAELVGDLAAGQRVGEAFETMSERVAALVRSVQDQARRHELGQPVDEALEAHCLLAEADARHFQIVGDPAARVVA